MVYTKSHRLKTLAAVVVGLFSLGRCAPFSAADIIDTNASVTDSATSTLTSAHGLVTGDKAGPTSFTRLVIPDPFSPAIDDEVMSKDDLKRLSGLYGITVEQVKTFQLEDPDRELAEPPESIDLNQTGFDFHIDDYHRKIPVEARAEEQPVRPRPLEVTEDELEAIKQLANSQSGSGFWLGLLNGTPYRWELMAVKGEDVGSSFSVQLPPVLQPGDSITWTAKMSSNDAHAEVRYNLVGTAEEAWFTLNIHRGFPHKVTVQYGGALETIGLGDSGKRGSVVDLGVDRGVVCATFYLTGVEGRFFANDAPANWMHAMLDDIGNHTLRDVMLPRSHRAGMYTGHKPYGLGNRINTFTQDFSIYYQLKVGGVRVLDLSPLLEKDGSIWETHGTLLGPEFHGGTGVSHDSLIAQINKFNDDFPGELIILDVNGKEMRDGKKFKPLHGAGVAKIIDSFKRLKHRAVLVPGQDMSRIPLADLIGGGKSAVVIRMPADRIPGLPVGHGGWPGAKQGFVTAAELPVFRKWSNTDDEKLVLYDQVAGLQDSNRKDGNGTAAREVYEADLVLTQKGKAVFGKKTITALNAPAWVMLIKSFWAAFTGAAYPNWVAMDAIRGSSLKGVAMAVNQCFVAKRCGPLGGRVLAAETVRGSRTGGNGTASTIPVNQ